jgi:hemerythrin
MHLQSGSQHKLDESSIADEHRSLSDNIERISELLDIYFSGKNGLPRQDQSQILISLKEFLKIARGHFEHEEMIMEKNNYSGLAPHKRDHDYLIESLNDFIWSINYETIQIPVDTLPNLRSWLSFHINKFDNAYFQLNEKTASNPGL